MINCSFVLNFQIRKQKYVFTPPVFPSLLDLYSKNLSTQGQFLFGHKKYHPEFKQNFPNSLNNLELSKRKKLNV